MSGDAVGGRRQTTRVNGEAELVSGDEASGLLSLLPIGPMPRRLRAPRRRDRYLDDQPRDGQVDS
jgi:hypothetical protein